MGVGGSIDENTQISTPVSVADGGTGVGTLTGVLTGNGTSDVTANAVTEGGVLIAGASNAVGDTGVLAKGTILVGDGVTAPTALVVGADTEVLTADSVEASGVKWVAAGGGAWELISSATASNDATVEFTGLSSTYFMYMVVVDSLVPATDGTILWMRTSTDNGISFDSGASDYDWFEDSFENDGSPVQNLSGVKGDSKMSLVANTHEIGNDTGENASMVIKIINPSSVNYTKIMVEATWTADDTDQNYGNSTGYRNSAADVDAIQFLMNTGNITSGEFKLYGLKAS